MNKNIYYLYVMAIVLLGRNIYGQEVFNFDRNKTSSAGFETGEQHYYNIELSKGEFSFLVLQQNDIDVVITTIGPSGDTLDRFDTYNGSNGEEFIRIDAHESGLHGILIQPLGEKKKKEEGSYSMKALSITKNLKLHLDYCFKYIGDKNHLPGFTLSIFNEKEVLYKNSQGFANLKKGIPYSENTIQQVESISKTFIGISIMQLVESGKLDLDADINEYLSFEVHNPYYPNVPITLRQLATHTASIKDNRRLQTAIWLLDPSVYERHKKKYVHKAIAKEYSQVKMNKEISMAHFVKSYFDKKGKAYSKKNYFKYTPGSEWYYSNVGATLAAYIVEVVAQQPYDEYVKEHIIKPLELENSYWNHDIEDSEEIAQKYSGNKLPYSRLGSAIYPDGGMWMSTVDLRKYLMHWMGGRSKGSDLLSSKSFNEIMQVQYEESNGEFKGLMNGLFWWQYKDKREGHNGGNNGSTANMYYYPEYGVGYTSLNNVMLNESVQMTEMYTRIEVLIRRYVKYFEKK